jgi:hypothetical protein
VTGNHAYMRICSLALCTLTACVADSFPPPPGITALHRAFVTDGAFAPDFGGIAGADSLCQTEADAVKLGGSWLAWIADDTGDPVSRFDHSGAYVRLDGVLVAGNFDELVSGTLENAITSTPSGEYLPIGAAWTNVAIGGHAPGPEAPLANASCANWTSRDISLQGGIGQYNFSSREWTFLGTDTCDADADHPNHLYCFEQ